MCVQDVLRSLHMLLTVGGVVSSLSHRSSSHRNQPVELHADKLDKQESAQVSRHAEAHCVRLPGMSTRSFVGEATGNEWHAVGGMPYHVPAVSG